MPKTTVICHFRNEEALLPFWLKHHRNLFDDGVLINYYSTDSSLDIIKDLAPHWRVVNTKNKQFSTFDIDNEVMEYEAQIEEWKMALNVTEFLFCKSLNDHVQTHIDNHSTNFVVTKGFIMQDPEHMIDVPLDYSQPIWEQRHWGMPEPDPTRGPAHYDRSRLLHKEKTGRYGPGRHTNEIGQVLREPILYLLWYGWSPIKLKVQRNESTRPMLNQDDLGKGWGSHHLLGESAIMKQWWEYSHHVYDIFGGKHPQLDAIRLSLRTEYNN
jgi:hypothetical protein